MGNTGKEGSRCLLDKECAGCFIYGVLWRWFCGVSGDFPGGTVLKGPLLSMQEMQEMQIVGNIH